MQVHFESLDNILGIIAGIVLIGITGILFTLPSIPIFVLGIFFAVSAILTIIDVVLCIKDFGSMHKLMILGIFVSSIIYLLVEIGMAGKYLNITMPFVTQYVLPVLSNSLYLFAIGVFFVITSLLWLIDTLRA